MHPDQITYQRMKCEVPGESGGVGCRQTVHQRCQASGTPQIAQPIAQTTRAEIAVPSPETISKLEEAGRLGFAVRSYCTRTRYRNPAYIRSTYQADMSNVGFSLAQIALHSRTTLTILNFGIRAPVENWFTSTCSISPQTIFRIFFEVPAGHAYHESLPEGAY
jgi:hypothetical protein